MGDTYNMLSVLEGYIGPTADEVSKKLSDDFRRRRVEKALTREAMASKSGVAVANIARFEQKGLISLKNLIQLAMALGYLSEIENVFSVPKYSTMEELLQIRKNMGKKRAGTSKTNKDHDKD